jgi:hypothetical protein
MKVATPVIQAARQFPDLHTRLVQSPASTNDEHDVRACFFASWTSPEPDDAPGSGLRQACGSDGPHQSSAYRRRS